LAVSAAATVAALVCAELGARLFLPRPQSARIYAREDYKERLDEENSEPASFLMPKGMQGRFIFETPTGFRLRANTVAVIGSHKLSHTRVEIRTNSRGFRGPEIGEKQGTRVLFLGDSITLADYLREEDTFVRRVEELFREDGRAVETINAGVGAIGLANELAILLETGLEVDPDVVVVGFYLNDAESSAGVELLELPAALRWSRLAHYVALAMPGLVHLERTETDLELRRAWADEVRAAYPPAEGDPMKDPAAFPQLIQQAWFDWGTAWSESAWERIEPIVRELDRQARLEGFRLLFLCFPVREQVEAEFVSDLPQRRLSRILDELDVPLLDLLPLLRAEHRASNETLFYDQCHHTPYASARIAEWIHDFLEREL
jgi:lysophospholipase L1-like esterase